MTPTSVVWDPVASNVNQLWGDYFIMNGNEDFAFGDNLVHVEAEDGFSAASTPTGYTFYGRYTGATGGADAREPLGTTWAVRYLDGGAFDGGTDLLVWRDSTSASTDAFYSCGGGPAWVPLNETEVVAFDEEENAVELCYTGPGGVISPPQDESDPACFPLETQRVAYGDGDLDGPYDFGWLYLNLNVGDDADDDFDPGSNGTLAQSYVAAAHSALGRFQVGLSAIALTSACEERRSVDHRPRHHPHERLIVLGVGRGIRFPPVKADSALGQSPLFFLCLEGSCVRSCDGTCHFSMGEGLWPVQKIARGHLQSPLFIKYRGLWLEIHIMLCHHVGLLARQFENSVLPEFATPPTRAVV